ncbi:hypothetical protein [Flaviaesturariibacter terrae]
MNTFRFVLYTWLCAVLSYPVIVMICDVLTRSSTELHLFLPLLAGAIVLGLPALLLGWLALSLLQVRSLSPLLQYTLWTGAVLLLVWTILSLLGRPELLDFDGEFARFIVPLFGTALLVLLLRYPYYRDIPVSEY